MWRVIYVFIILGYDGFNKNYIKIFHFNSEIIQDYKSDKFIEKINENKENEKENVENEIENKEKIMEDTENKKITEEIKEKYLTDDIKHLEFNKEMYENLNKYIEWRRVDIQFHVNFSKNIFLHDLIVGKVKIPYYCDDLLLLSQNFIKNVVSKVILNDLNDCKEKISFL
jgi:hypothetical protein